MVPSLAFGEPPRCVCSVAVGRTPYVIAGTEIEARAGARLTYAFGGLTASRR
jgi:N-acetylmuramic acid 6-phosphate (MurNAc-6-P) etherase